MSRRVRVPSYRLHKQSGQAIVTLPDGFGGRRDITLGNYGSPESRAEYVRVIAQWEANGRRLLLQTTPTPSMTIAELALAFWKHAEQHYRHPDGTVTHELSEYRMALRPLNHLFGHLPASNFGPLALKSIRQLMISGYDHPKLGPQPALCRGVTN